MFKFLILLLLVVLILRYINKLINSILRPNNSNTNQYAKKQEGEVTINTKTSASSKLYSKEDGEYADYEEIK